MTTAEMVEVVTCGALRDARLPDEVAHALADLAREGAKGASAERLDALRAMLDPDEELDDASA